MTTVITLIGPSHAGKTTTLRYVAGPACNELPCALNYLDLDKALGQAHRSDAERAAALIREHASGETTLLVDVGAGQIVQPAFRSFLRREQGLVPVAIWCDERTFRSRHAPEAVEREVRNNYSPELCALWELCRSRGHLVDTSAPSTPVEWASNLRVVVRRLMRVR